ncbi:MULTISPECIES: hypothetical protein [unclassified Streptomyces]|nr:MULTISPECIES: hypothetical protein [unclassified Streptomyces]MYX34801.1 hypothetical protein [Streptomyces sp. SID8377]
MIALIRMSPSAETGLVALVDAESFGVLEAAGGCLGLLALRRAGVA